MKALIRTSIVVGLTIVVPAFAAPNNGGFSRNPHNIQMHEDANEILDSVTIGNTAVGITSVGATSKFNLGFVASIGQINDWTGLGPNGTTFLDIGSDQMVFSAIRTGGIQTDTAVTFTSDANLGESIMDVEFRTQGMATYTITSADEKNGRTEVPEPSTWLLMMSGALVLFGFRLHRSKRIPA
jgi:hypothetical protein